MEICIITELHMKLVRSFPNCESSDLYGQDGLQQESLACLM